MAEPDKKPAAVAASSAPKQEQEPVLGLDDDAAAEKIIALLGEITRSLSSNDHYNGAADDVEFSLEDLALVLTSQDGGALDDFAEVARYNQYSVPAISSAGHTAADAPASGVDSGATDGSASTSAHEAISYGPIRIVFGEHSEDPNGVI